MGPYRKPGKATLTLADKLRTMPIHTSEELVIEIKRGLTERMKSAASNGKMRVSGVFSVHHSTTYEGTKRALAIVQDWLVKEGIGGKCKNTSTLIKYRLKWSK